ncbi:hypothetical protein JWG45_05305 [Leptospira sp. 201903070]|jgi:hypothetical protein|uniref:Lipoprotein n=1 Tax=Leptospira ainlahdjerensis TaxID=2810033 RepID=A0ABS2U871_9LEPT|nr:hypothetical protein [Leptospira ainlahdjerensis]MBM9576567.1 hypothetical protein [Leptospira ainlahdjerensis]
MKKIIISIFLTTVFAAGCKPCSTLEERICIDLGSKCEKWKSLGKPGIPSEDQDEYRSGRKKLVSVVLESLGLIERNAQACQGLSSNYDALIVPIKKALQ